MVLSEASDDDFKMLQWCGCNREAAYCCGTVESCLLMYNLVLTISFYFVCNSSVYCLQCKQKKYKRLKML
jgi:hypothetical protein